jgi:hypothetical protein
MEEGMTHYAKYCECSQCNGDGIPIIRSEDDGGKVAEGMSDMAEYYEDWDDFYEEDEDPDDLLAKFESSDEKGKTIYSGPIEMRPVSDNNN